jgi:hypothetical protein
MVMRRITAGTNSSSASGLCSASLAPLFWSVLKRASEEFPDLNNNQYMQPSPTSFWSPAWAICIAVLALQVLADATFHLPLAASSPPPQVLMATFARSASTTLPNVLAAIAQIFGKGGRVYRSIGFLEGPPDLEQAISAIWGKASVEEKWIKGVVGLPPLNEGKLSGNPGSFYCLNCVFCCCCYKPLNGSLFVPFSFNLYSCDIQLENACLSHVVCRAKRLNIGIPPKLAIQQNTPSIRFFIPFLRQMFLTLRRIGILLVFQSHVTCVT